MSADPQTIRSEVHEELGDFLLINVEVIIERWSIRAVEEQPNASRVHHSVLLDHLHDLLTTLGDRLKKVEDPQESQHCLTALRHGEQRWEAGWSLPEVVRDYQILRFVILDFLEERFDRPLKYREVLAIGLALDEAIAASVVMYVNGRDDYRREVEQKRAEEDKRVHGQLKAQTEALQEADRRKNKFLAILGHELRNPLAPIRNSVKILELKHSRDQESRKALEVIERQVQQMTRIVDDLLDISRITQGKIKLQAEPVEVAKLVNRTIEMVRPLLDSRKQQLNLILPPDAIWVEGDPPRLIQVLANLLTNASKFTDENGHIWLILERQNNNAVIKVRDSGIGIPAEWLQYLFVPFEQEERSLDRAGRPWAGAGLGTQFSRSAWRAGASI